MGATPKSRPAKARRELQSSPSSPEPDLPGVILAGGRSRRMGGGDKGLLPLGGLRVLDHVLARLGTQCRPVALNANGDPARFGDLGLEVLPDSVPDWPGPLAGVLAAMDWAARLGAQQVVTVAAYTPFFPPDLVARLRAGAGAGGLAVAARLDGKGGARTHPTFALWPVTLRQRLREDLAAGERRVGRWAEAQGAAVVAFACDGADPFFNINTPDDLAEAGRLLARWRA